MDFKKLGGTFLKGMKKAHKTATSEKTKSTIRKIQARGERMQNVATGTNTASKKTVKAAHTSAKKATKKPVKKTVVKSKRKTTTKRVSMAGYKNMGTYTSKVRATKEAKFYRTEGAKVKIITRSDKYNVYVAGWD